MKDWIDNSSAELRRLYLHLEAEIKQEKEQADRERAGEQG